MQNQIADHTQLQFEPVNVGASFAQGAAMQGQQLENQLTQMRIDAASGVGNALTGSVQSDGSLDPASYAQQVTQLSDPGARGMAYEQGQQMQQQWAQQRQASYAANKEQFDAFNQAVSADILPKIDPQTYQPLTDPSTGQPFDLQSEATNTITNLVKNHTLTVQEGMRGLSQIANASTQGPQALGRLAMTAHMLTLNPEQLTQQTISAPQTMPMAQTDPRTGLPITVNTPVRVTNAGIDQLGPGVNPGISQAQATPQAQATLSNGVSVAGPAGTVPGSSPLAGAFTPHVGVPAEQGGISSQPLPPQAGMQQNAQQSGAQQPIPQPLAPGQEQFLADRAKAQADAANATQQAAADAPAQMNVLDNIIQLSKNGIASGPGQQWQNEISGLVANTPVLSNAMGGAKDYLSQAQELGKFLQRNAANYWAQAGASTDMMRNTFSASNPSDKMFPQAVQEMAEYAKAGQMAALAKANAQSSINPQDPNAQASFEAQWRNNMDPRIFQLQTYDQAGQQKILSSMTKPEIAQLRQKYAVLRQLQGGGVAGQ